MVSTSVFLAFYDLVLFLLLCLPSSPLGDGMAKACQWSAAKGKVFPMAIGKKLCFAQTDSPVFVDKRTIYLVAKYLRDKQVMGTQLGYALHAALQGYWTDFQGRDGNINAGFEFQTEMFNLIELAAGTAAAKISHFQHLSGCQVYDKFAGRPDILIGQSLLTYGDGHHRWM